MNKDELIRYWLDTSKKDWKVVQHLLKSKDYLYSLFFAHLVLEKLCKAHWIKDNKGNYPPKIHNLNKLVSETKLELSEEERTFMADFNKFQIEGRYPDYISNVNRLVNGKYTVKYLKECNQLRKKLIARLLLK